MSNKDIPWPPKSPADVLLLTPKKSKLTAPDSPSPLRTSSRPPPLSPALGGRLPSKLDDDGGLDDVGSTSEDEETLQLKLARIEAKLKLKQLQKKRKRADSAADQQNPNVALVDAEGTTIGPVPSFNPAGSSSAAAAGAGAAAAQAHAHARSDVNIAEPRSRYARASTPVAQIQVAASPEKKAPPSPSRVLLGLDKGLRAKDVSLKRPPNLRFPHIAGVSRPTTKASTGGTSSSLLDDPFSPQPSRSGGDTGYQRNPSPTMPVTKTFNQRVAEARIAENEKKAKLETIEKSRSKGFGLSKEEIGSSTGPSTDAPVSSLEAGRLGINIESVGPLKTSIWTTSCSADAANSRPSTVSSTLDPPKPPSSSSFTFSTEQSITTSTTTGYDSFSQLHLSNRTIPHTTLSRALQQKTIYLLPDLLKTVVSPTYEPPGVEGDWVVMGIICSKSEPRQTTKGYSNTKAASKDSAGDKYMVMQLTDLKWDIELFLFGSGFERFWKVAVGTVVAILNPGIMKPRNPDSGKFSLTLSSSEDTLLEIGQARDLGFCKSVKRDGKTCTFWVDKRRMEYCAFHVEMAVKKAANSRMELNNMGKLFSPPRKGSLRSSVRFLNRGGGSRGGGGGGAFRDDGLLPEGPLPDLPQRAGGAGGKVYIYPSRGTNALFDDSFQDAFHNGTREERMRKQLAKGEREREIARRLVSTQKKISGGDMSAGAEYLRKALEQEERRLEKNGESVEALGPTMQSLGLNKGRMVKNNEDYTSLTKNRTIAAADIRLSPLKRRRIARPLPSPPPQPPLPSLPASKSGSEGQGPQKKPRVHFNRPVVTGVDIISAGGRTMRIVIWRFVRGEDGIEKN
ncbi:hypothetical protein BDZ91DRAFT_764933 [Kalaharituber pfeilii]|nr:hypothetical protein BDZ91DRAFT_764933 [Kalaharituber pfeilii]